MKKKLLICVLILAFVALCGGGYYFYQKFQSESFNKETPGTFSDFQQYHRELLFSSNNERKRSFLNYKLGGLSYDLHNFDDAIQYYNAALEISDFEAIFRFKIIMNLAAAYMQKKNYMESQKCYHTAYVILLKNKLEDKISVEDAECLYSNYAASCKENGDYKQAILMFHKSLELIPEVYGNNSEFEIKTDYHLADTFYRNGDFVHAEEYYKKALKNYNLDGNPMRFRGAICWGLSKVYQKMNKTALAAKYANFAMQSFEESLSPDPRIEEIRRWLKNSQVSVKN